MEKNVKAEIIAKYAIHEGDTGSPEVQIALLTHRINHLTEHLKVHRLEKESLELSQERRHREIQNHSFQAGNQKVISEKVRASFSPPCFFIQGSKFVQADEFVFGLRQKKRLIYSDR